MNAKANILIVEDSFIVGMHLQMTLEAEKYKVLKIIDNGEDALQYISSEKPDLVLMDIMLAGHLDGIEAAAEIRNRYHIPVIYITALTDKGTIERAKHTEPYGYLTKPFEDREIYTVIEMALYKHKIELKLRQSEEQYYATVNSISDAVITVDRDFKILFMNPTAIAMTQVTLKNAVGDTIFNILKLEDENSHEINVNPIQCSLDEAGINRMPSGLLLINKGGSKIPIGESSLSPMLDNKRGFIGLIIIFKDLTERREREILLQEIENKRITALIEGQERERARIAKDLHDGLGQMLNAIKMSVSLIPSNDETVKQVYEGLNEAIQESIRMAENLLPSKLRHFGLAVSLRSLCDSISKSLDVQVQFKTHGDKLDLGELETINIYRIVQEAVNNSIKHSAAKNIYVQLFDKPNSISLSIEDDGKGMIQGENLGKTTGNGLINMKDRAKIMGGQLAIESKLNSGTLVLLEIPKMKINEQ